jgi:type VI protein secretion system component Hcp
LTRWRTNSIIARIPALPAHQPEQEPPERTPTSAAPEPGISPAPAQQVLALQRQVGNRAVGALLARAPKTKKPPKMPAPKPPTLADGVYAVVPGIGIIPLHSAQMGSTISPNTPGRGADREPVAPKLADITVSADQGDHSDQIFRAAIQGDNLGVVEIRFVKGGKTYMAIKLHNAMITSFNVSGAGGDTHGKPLESWTFNGDKIEYETNQMGDAPPPG